MVKRELEKQEELGKSDSKVVVRASNGNRGMSHDAVKSFSLLVATAYVQGVRDLGSLHDIHSNHQPLRAKKVDFTVLTRSVARM